MAARFLQVDSGGTTRLTKRWPVVDGGGTTRLLKRAFVIDAGGTGRLIFRSDLYVGSITQGLSTVGFGDYFGFAVGGVPGAIGSRTPTTDANGNTVYASYDTWENFTPSYTNTRLIIAAGSNPGQGYFTTAVINGNVRASASATYSYGGGQALWIWNSGACWTGFGAGTLTYG